MRRSKKKYQRNWNKFGLGQPRRFVCDVFIYRISDPADYLNRHTFHCLLVGNEGETHPTIYQILVCNHLIYYYYYYFVFSLFRAKWNLGNSQNSISTSFFLNNKFLYIQIKVNNNLIRKKFFYL